MLSEADAIRRMQALAQWYREHPLEWFEPSPALADFMVDESKLILVRAASRVGKTQHAGAKLARYLLDHPETPARAVGLTHSDTAKILGGVMHHFLPKDALHPSSEYDTERGWKNRIARLKNGSFVEFKSDEQGASKHAGRKLKIVWHDEPPSCPVLEESQTRVFDSDGCVWVTATPINRPVEYFRKMVEAENSPWKQYQIALTHENCPWYTHEQIEAFIAKARLVPDAFRQRIYGDWDGVSLDRVYSGYASTFHFSDLREIPANARWGVGIDHGEGVGKQVAILIAWDVATNRLWIVAEYVSTERATPEKDAVAIRQMLLSTGRDVHNIDRWVGDTNSAGKAAAGESVNSMLAAGLAKAAGLPRLPRAIETPNKRSGSVRFGEQLINAAFLRGQIRVCSARCPTMLRTLSHYSGEEDLKHASDALRYIAHDILDKSSSPVLSSVGFSFPH